MREEMIKRRSTANKGVGWVLLGLVLVFVRQKQSFRGQKGRGRDHQGGWVERPLSADWETGSPWPNSLGHSLWAAGRGPGGQLESVMSILGVEGPDRVSTAGSFGCVAAGGRGVRVRRSAAAQLTLPRSGEIFAIPSCPSERATECGAWFRLSETAVRSSFCSVRICTISSCPFSIAHESGVRPYLPGWSGLTSSDPKNIFTTPSCPFSAAHESGVRPEYVLAWLGLTSFRSKSIFTIPSSFSAAHESGVQPCLVSGWSGSTSFCSKSIFTPFHALS